MPNNSLKNKVLKGVGWSATDNLLHQGISFIIGLILARILSPAEYGLIGLAMVVITILSSFVDGGFSSALIRKKDVSEADYNTMFVFNMVVSISAYILLYITAPLIARFMEADITLLIRVLGVTLIIHAFAIVQNTNLSKNINFKIPAITTSISSIISGIAGVICAFNGWGVWALVVQQLSSAMIRVVVLWALNPWHPSIQFSGTSMRYIWSFGWKILLSQVLNQTWKQIYVIFVGKVYSPATLGQYSRARHYAQFVSSNLNGIVSKVTFPTLSTLQDNPGRMVEIYRRVIKVTMLVTVACTFTMAAISEPLIYCLIGEKWMEAASYLPYICVAVSLTPLHSINMNMLMIQNRSDIYLLLEIVRKIVAVLPIIVGMYFGIKWMLVGVIFTAVINYFLNSYYSGRNLNYSAWKQLKDVAPAYMVGSTVALSIYFLKYLPISNFIILPLQLIVGTVVLLTVCEISNLPEYVEIKNIVLDVLQKFKKN